ncbi:MAG: helix-turn-helix domain-containing protein [Janthinobacterium lividum]
MVSRIKQLLDWQQLSSTQFADRIGVGRPVVSHILSERNKPSLEVVQRIIAAFPDLSLPWLLSGNGAMLAVEATAATEAPETITPPDAASFDPSPFSDSLASALPSFSALAPALVPAPAEAPLLALAAGPREVPIAAFAPLPELVARPQFAAQAAPPARYRAGKPPLPAAPEVAATPAAAPLPDPTKTPTPSPKTEAAPPIRPAPVAISAPHSAVEAPTAPLAEQPTQPLAANVAALTTSLVEPGKAIRRIVVFYRDGSFADYQPE